MKNRGLDKIKCNPDVTDKKEKPQKKELKCYRGPFFRKQDIYFGIFFFQVFKSCSSLLPEIALHVQED